jgi:hypothetical protein
MTLSKLGEVQPLPKHYYAIGKVVQREKHCIQKSRLIFLNFGFWLSSGTLIELAGLYKSNSASGAHIQRSAQQARQKWQLQITAAESEKLSRKGHSLLTWPRHQKFAQCASTVHMITTFVVCVMAVFVKKLSCYLRFQSSEMSNLLVHLVIQRSCPTRFDFTFQSQCG